MRNFFLPVVVLAASAACAGTTTWTATTSPVSWSDATHWSAGVPAEGDDAILQQPGTAFNLDLDQSASLHSLTQNQGKDKKAFALLRKNNATLTLGAGGFTVNPYAAYSETDAGEALAFYVPITLAASQTWSYDMPMKWGTFAGIRSDISGASDVVWKLRGRNRLQFLLGSSENFLGKVEANLFLRFTGASQINRLGKAGATITSGTIDDVPGYPGLFFEATTAADFVCETPFTLYATNTLSGSSNYKPFALDLVAVDPAGHTSLRFAKPFTGIVADKQLLFTGYRLHSYDSYGAVGATSIHRRDMVRLILDRDNAQLVPKTAGAQIYLSMCLNLGHANALGTANGAFDLLMYPNDLDYTYGHSGIVGVFASNGVSVAANLLTPKITSGSTAGRFDRFVVGTDGPGTSVFSGELKSLGTKFNDSPGFRFMPDSNSTVRVTGQITDLGPLEVVGRGDTVLANAANTVANDSVRIRGGRLIVGAAGAIGSASVLLGDDVPNRVTVKAMGVGRICLTYDNGALAFSSEDGKVNNVMTFGTKTYVKPSSILAETIDGVAINIGDRVLLNTPYTSSYKHNPTILPNGIWERIADDADTGNMRWKRVTWMDDVADMESSYGLRVDIEQGEKFAGQTVYFANREEMAKDEFDFVSDRLGFHEETEPQPNCALLTETPMTLANQITVTDNKSTGISTIGTLAAGKTTFTGLVTVERDVVLTAPAGATLAFNGGFAGTGSVIIDGEGASFEIATYPGDPVRYQVKHGTVTYKMSPESQALFHIDPSVKSSLTMEEGTYESETVTNVLRWADVRGLAVGRAQAVAREFREGQSQTDPTFFGITRQPAYRVVETAPGWQMPVIDTHDLFIRDSKVSVTNSAALDLRWQNGTTAVAGATGESVFKQIRQAYVIAKDNVPYGNSVGCSFLGTTRSCHNQWYARGEKGKMIAPAKESAWLYSDSVIAGTNEVDGVRVDVLTQVYPEGYHLISFAPTGDTWVATLAVYGNYRRGGLTYGEVILFTNTLDEVSHKLLTAQLMNKWFNAGIGTGAITNDVALLSLSGGVTTFEGIGAVRTPALETAGAAAFGTSLVLAENATLDIAYTDATHAGGVAVSGTLALPARATVRVTIPTGSRPQRAAADSRRGCDRGRCLGLDARDAEREPSVPSLSDCAGRLARPPNRRGRLRAVRMQVFSQTQIRIK